VMFAFRYGQEMQAFSFLRRSGQAG
jgi:hypothetical protein